jgi:putative membrane protein
MSDPRVFFASERTLLAWVRSGLTVMGLGFVVARFGLFLRYMALSRTSPEAPMSRHWVSNGVGIFLLLLGSALIVGAWCNHKSFIRSLPPGDVPPLAVPWLSASLSLSIALVGLLLAGYLAFA